MLQFSTMPRSRPAGVDAAPRPVNGAAIATDFTGVALGTLVLGDEPGSQVQVGAFEDVCAWAVGEQRQQKPAQAGWSS